jgi:hypothetical protein
MVSTFVYKRKEEGKEVGNNQLMRSKKRVFNKSVSAYFVQIKSPYLYSSPRWLINPTSSTSRSRWSRFWRAFPRTGRKSRHLLIDSLQLIDSVTTASVFLDQPETRPHLCFILTSQNTCIYRERSSLGTYKPAIKSNCSITNRSHGGTPSTPQGLVGLECCRRPNPDSMGERILRSKPDTAGYAGQRLALLCSQRRHHIPQRWQDRGQPSPGSCPRTADCSRSPRGG